MDNIEFEREYKESGFSSQRRYPNEALIQFLGRNYFFIPIKDRKKIKILEIGCGSGANLWMMAREGFDTYGNDNSKTGLKLCEQMLKSWKVKANLFFGNMRKLDFKDNFFDAIVDVVSMQHTNLLGHREVLKESFRCLKNGGRFFSYHLGNESVSFKKSGGKKIDEFTVDNIENKNVPLAGNGMTCFLSAKEAKKIMSQAGFCDIQIEKVERTYKDMKQKIEYLVISGKKNEN